MLKRRHIRQSLSAALPIMLGYLAIGIPCGILSASIGMNALQVLLLSALFYSGAGQFMIPNMWATATPIASMIASISLVNTRQTLYSASLSQFCQQTKKRLSFLFAATVTDESYGVNMLKFAEGDWSVSRATMVNLFSQSSWAVSSVIGALIGNVVSVPLAIASFAMTSIFICLLCVQKITTENVVGVLAATVGVVCCKLLGLNGPAILIGAVIGVLAALVTMWARPVRNVRTAEDAQPARDARHAGDARTAGDAQGAESGLAEEQVERQARSEEQIQAEEQVRIAERLAEAPESGYTEENET